MRLEDRDRLAQEIEALERQISDLRRRALGEVQAAPRLPDRFRLLVCRIGELEVAVQQDEIDEVQPICTLTPLAEAPAWIPGLLNLHGTTVPVIDVLGRVTRQPRRAGTSELILVKQTRRGPYGFLVQAIVDLAEGRGDELQAVPPDLQYAPYLLGVLRRGTGLIPLFSIERLLDFSDVPSPA